MMIVGGSTVASSGMADRHGVSRIFSVKLPVRPPVGQHLTIAPARSRRSSTPAGVLCGRHAVARKARHRVDRERFTLAK
jgi:hypothetical protein